ncbi:MAG: efflux transporter outer membrane subunit [Dyadobacter sp.]|uniref:efflux transporter outer membrane subunit n=1 Tax=Dyadobacter sp. TaxID=1914288 RepID=UPI001B204359|nr:efflux transporter outer membrane subunit [Dyadobacter sp.]MBO9611173.1 efflux transporter outer membrane subunit [Dyadobacter sp.]
MRTFNRYIITGLILALSLSACRVGKEYRRADLKLPEKYRQSGNTQSPVAEPIALTADSVKLSWRAFFRDTTLATLIEKALVHNNDIAVAMMNMQQLDLTYRQAKLGLLPTADFSVGANRTWLSTNSLNGSLSDQFLGTSYMDDYSATIRLSWEADIWGKTRMQREGALANYFAQKENLSALRTRIVVQVAQAYYNLVTLDEQLKIARRNVELGDSTLNMIRLQYASAQVNSLALEQAVAQKKTAELLIPAALQDIAVQENALGILCGSYPDSIQRSGAASALVSGMTLPADVPARLLSRRPDVKAAEYAVIAANSQTGLAKAAMYPAISLTPSIGANSFKFNTWFDLPGSMVKSVAVNIAQPLFQKKQLKTAYKIAQIEQQKAAVQFRQSVLTAVGEVSDALAKSEHVQTRLRLVGEKKESLTKANQDALVLYRSGMATYLEVITAQNNALQNDLEAINIRREQYNAVMDLYRALGGGDEQ